MATIDDAKKQLLKDIFWQMNMVSSATDGELVTVALSQVGNVGGEPYWSWYGFGGRVEWCACYVSWCANECGYIKTGVIPKFAGCVQGPQWFKDRGLWQDNSFDPRHGDIIFFDWDDGGQDGSTGHVGYVFLQSYRLSFCHHHSFFYILIRN